ncbi:MAG: hypothetical protein J5988_07030 [Eubacterium sp.]|nr:hypothetical protein [Eubacterium sp.]
MSKKTSSQNPPKKKKHSKLKWTIIIIAALVVTAFLTFFIYMKQMTKPTRLVDRYVSTFMSKDSDSLFDLIGFETGTFITKDAFAKSMEECHQYSSITTYSLVPGNSQGDNQMQYNLSFWDDNHNNPYNQTLLLNLSSSRLYFLFDQWEIDTTEFLAKNCSLAVPTGATVTVDGIDLSEHFSAVPDEDLDVYELGSLFMGTHDITVSIKGFEDYTTTTSLPAGDYSGKKIYTITTSMLKVTADTEKNLKQLAESFITSIYEGALTEQDFDSISKDFTVEEDSKDSLKLAYDTLVSNNITTASHLSKVDFTNFDSSTAATYAEDGCYAIQVTSDVNYTAESIVSSGSGDETASQQTRKTTSGNSLFTTIFHYKDGVWSINTTTALDACVYYIKY